MDINDVTAGAERDQGLARRCAPHATEGTIALDKIGVDANGICVGSSRWEKVDGEELRVRVEMGPWSAEVADFKKASRRVQASPSSWAHGRLNSMRTPAQTRWAVISS